MGIERPFTVSEIRSHRNEERLRDIDWVECPECRGTGLIESDPYGYGRSYVCDHCGGAGGWDGEAHCSECDEPLGPTDHCVDCGKVDVNPVFK